MRRRKKNGTGIGIIVFVVLILCGIVSYSRIGLAQEKAEKGQKIERLNTMIKEEEVRSAEIKDLKEYSKTKQYIEDIARDKLGLVYKDEIIFEPEK